MRAFYDPAKCQKRIGPRAFRSIQKSSWNTLWNLSFMETFWVIFAKWPRKVLKSIMFTSKTLQNVNKALVLEHFGASGKVDKIPYRTCRLWILFVSISQNGYQKYQKSIRFSTKSWMRFTTLQNVKKALVLEHFGASEKVDKNTL